jgi:hypothetical protein
MVKCLGERTDASGYRFANGKLSKALTTGTTTAIRKYRERRSRDDVRKKWPLNGPKKTKKEALFSTV